MIKYLFLFFSITFQGQVLHHQMLSSQGTSTKTPDGLIIMQTVGQQSLSGTAANKDYIIMQGFQQSFWGRYIASNDIYAIEGIKTTTYPNPFTQVINFQFSKPVTDVISLSVFDVSGRLLYEQSKPAVNNILSVDLSRLPTSKFLIHLKTNNLNYYTVIIKK